MNHAQRRRFPVSAIEQLRPFLARLVLSYSCAIGTVCAQISVEAGKCADGEFISLDLAMDYCDRAIASTQLGPKERANAYYNRSVGWSRRNMPFRALSDLDEAIRLYPQFAPSFKARGIIKLSRREYVQAGADFDEAIRLTPELTEAFILRGQSRLGRNDADRAIEDFRKALEMRPSVDLNAYYGAGIAFTGRKPNYDRTPNDSAAYLGRSAAYVLKDDPERSAADLKEWMSLNPKAANLAHRMRAGVWMRMDQFDRAIADYNQAILLNPTDRVAIATRGLASMLKMEFSRAITDYSEAIRMNPRDYAPLRLRGYTKFYQGEHAAAVADLNIAIHLNPNDPFIAMWLFLARARSSPADALPKLRAELASRTEKMRRRAWPYPLVALLVGEGNPESVIAFIKKDDEMLMREQSCEANYFIAQWHLLADNRQKATELLRSAETSCPQNFFERVAAVAELGRLSK